MGLCSSIGLWLVLMAISLQAMSFELNGFSRPMGLVIDAEGYIYVSNVNGDVDAKDKNGFISRIHPSGKIDDMYFISSNKHNVLHAPKGMAISGNKLIIADIDRVLVYNLKRKKFLYAIQSTENINFGHIKSVKTVGKQQILLVDSGRNTIWVYDREKKQTQVYIANVRLNQPQNMCWHEQQKVYYITSSQSASLFMYDKQGKRQFLSEIMVQNAYDCVVHDESLFITSSALTGVFQVNSSNIMQHAMHTHYPAYHIRYHKNQNQWIVSYPEFNQVVSISNMLE